MKTAIKTENLAGSTQQFLPGTPAAAVPPLRNLPGESKRSESGPLSAGETAAGATATRADFSTNNDTLLVRSNNPMVRISDVISREVRMFKRGGDDLVEVVLTPDPKTQISLRLQWREGQVEVQARCDLGDYQSLNTQWAQLQTSLAGHGVRLSHLSERAPTGFTEFFNNPSFAQQRDRNQQTGSPRHPAPASSRPAAAPTKPTAADSPRRSTRLFDFWA